MDGGFVRHILKVWTEGNLWCASVLGVRSGCKWHTASCITTNHDKDARTVSSSVLPAQQIAPAYAMKKQHSQSSVARRIHRPSPPKISSPRRPHSHHGPHPSIQGKRGIRSPRRAASSVPGLSRRWHLFVDFVG